MPSSKNTEIAVTELIVALGSLVRRVRSAAPSVLSDLSWTQKSVLTRLDKDGPMTTADLARLEGVKPQSMGTVIGTLEEMGLIERKPHPTDGRQVNIGLTVKGKSIHKDTRNAKQIWLTQAIEKLDKQEQTTLFAAGEIIKRLVDL